MKEEDEYLQQKSNSSNWFDEEHKLAKNPKGEKKSIQIKTLAYSPTNQFFQTQKNISETQIKIHSPLFNRTVYKKSPLRQ